MVVVVEELLLLQGHKLYVDCEPTNEFICTTESYRNPCAVQELPECSSLYIFVLPSCSCQMCNS